MVTLKNRSLQENNEQLDINSHSKLINANRVIIFEISAFNSQMCYNIIATEIIVEVSFYKF